MAWSGCAMPLWLKADPWPIWRQQRCHGSSSREIPADITFLPLAQLAGIAPFPVVAAPGYAAECSNTSWAVRGTWPPQVSACLSRDTKVTPWDGGSVLLRCYCFKSGISRNQLCLCPSLLWCFYRRHFFVPGISISSNFVFKICTIIIYLLVFNVRLRTLHRPTYFANGIFSVDLTIVYTCTLCKCTWEGLMIDTDILRW